LEVSVFSDVGPNFNRLIDDLRAKAEVSCAALRNKDRSEWVHPSEWAENPLTGFETPMQKAFRRDEENQIFLDATADADKPGAAIDVVVSQLQVDYIASWERAFRRRHLSRCRSAALAASRLRFHGRPEGPFVRGAKNSIQDAVRAAKVGEG
jgi:hypothetical protein